MNATQHQNIVGFIWNIANKLRGPYRPPQYRRVMLPLVVLRRLDLVLEHTKDKVLAEHRRCLTKGITGAALEKALSRVATGGERERIMKLNLRQTVIDFLKARPEERFKARQIAEWIFENLREACEEKRRNSKQDLSSDEALLWQLVAEIGANRPEIQKKEPAIRAAGCGR